MNKLLAFFLVTIISISGFSQSPNGRSFRSSSPGFTITGNVSGFPDSTLLYLDTIDNGNPVRIDSSFIVGGHFHFKGVLTSDVQQVIINTHHYGDYKFLWLENAPITFTAEKGKFRQAQITGSKTQDEQQQLDIAVTSRGNEKSADMEFIRRHPNSIVSADVLNVYATTWGRDTTALFYNMLSDKMKKTAYGKNILEFIQLNRNIKLGDKYVDFTQPDSAGKNVSVSDFICRPQPSQSAVAANELSVRCSNVLLLEFWGSWCGPCRQGNPELIKTYNEFKSKGFEILAVAADREKKWWTDAIRKDSLPWTNVSDLRGDRNKAAIIYGINKYPSSFLIDANGTIIAMDLRGEALRTKLREILK